MSLAIVVGCGTLLGGATPARPLPPVASSLVAIDVRDDGKEREDEREREYYKREAEREREY